MTDRPLAGALGVTTDEQKIIIRIMDEINRARRDEIGDLGVRVQGSGMHSSPTERVGIAEVTIEAAIRKNNLPEDMLVDMETAEEHIKCNTQGIIYNNILLTSSRL